MNHPMTHVIASRRLPWRDTDGTLVTIEARFGTPAPSSASPGAEEWYCPYEIERTLGDMTAESAQYPLRGAGEVLVRHKAFGSDSVQALYLALVMAGVEMNAIAGSPDSDSAYGPNFGFPKRLGET